MNRRDALKAVFGAGAVVATGGLVALAAAKPLTVADVRHVKVYLAANEVPGDFMPWRWDSQVHERMQALFAPAARAYSIQRAEWTERDLHLFDWDRSARLS